MKALKSQTIVADSLYVERRADRQLAQIVAQMGRPGYVLVSRQMGKTNLLLHAKRKLKKPGDLFVYLDASNSFPDIQSFFRNVVDVILESEEFSDEDPQRKILDRRNTSTAQPHKEHEWELREILRAISGRLVIFIDEIDALSTVAYSDGVFSFIRSVFFSGRGNWSEFNRLNYVLSGVAEASEIIKNKSVSPFNIGERIYLEDFSRAEFGEFIVRSGLAFSERIVNRIFFWTNGNPRLSWDVCSSIEDAIIAGSKIDDLAIDNIIRSIYFGNVDVPPVDHIKSLVTEHADLRDALVSIHYRKTEGISDKIRARLYLAGIASYDSHTQTVSIKNRILEESLNLEYLFELRDTTNSLLDKARNYFYASRYALAADVIDEYLNDGAQDGDANEARFMLGVCQYEKGESSEALKIFSMIGDDLPAKFANAMRYYSGMASMDELRISEAIDSYRKIVEGGFAESDAFYYYDAAVHLAKGLSLIGQEASPEIENFSRLVISGADDINRHIKDKEQQDGILLAAYMNLAHYKCDLGDADEALALSIEASKFASGYYKLAPLILRCKLARARQAKEDLLDRCVETVEETAKHFNPKEIEKIPFELIHDLFKLLDERQRTESIKSVTGIVLKSFGDSVYLEEGVLQLLSKVFKGSSRIHLTRVLIATVIDTVGAKLSMDVRRTYALLPVMLDSSDTGGKIHEDHLDALFSESSDLYPINQEFFALYKIITSDIGKKNFERAGRLVDVLRRATAENKKYPDQETGESVSWLVFYLQCIISIKMEEANSAKYIRDFLERTASVIKINLPLFKDDFVIEARRQLLSVLGQSKWVPRKRAHPKIGRNEIVSVIYENDRRSGKFKIFQDDLEKGMCRLAVDADD